MFRVHKIIKNTIYSFCQATRVLNAPPPRGKLTIIATPIGNMEDISPNMLRALTKADLIGCEDRRVAGHLFSLIRNRNILGDLNDRFGDIGLTAIVPADEKDGSASNQHNFYIYSNMNDKERRKFLSKMPI